MSAIVGVIANPAASKDIRRLVAQGRVVPDWEKVNIVRRALLGMQAVGIQKVVAMPDSSRLAERARNDVALSLELELLPMPLTHSESDTTLAAQLLGEMGAGCLLTLGGDGTNRAAVKGCAAIPMAPISTGTNNVFPEMIEGTLAGLAAGLIAQGRLNLAQAAIVSKTLEVWVDDKLRDIALVDVALSRERFVASRAIWDLSTIYAVFLTRAEPASIGLASVGARLRPVSLADEGGLYYSLDPADSDGAAPPITVLAPIAPGVVPPITVTRWGCLAEGERVSLSRRHYAVALDGERSFMATPEQQLEIVIRRNGPPVVQIEAALRQAAERGLFRV